MKFTFKLYDEIYIQHYETMGNEDNEDFTPIIHKAGYYVSVRCFTIIQKLDKTLDRFEENLSEFLTGFKSNHEKNNKKFINKLEKLNREEFKIAIDKLYYWRQRELSFPKAFEPSYKVKFIEDYINVSLDWFNKNNLLVPTLKITATSSNSQNLIKWNATELKLKRLFIEMMKREYLDSQTTELEFSSHFIVEKQIPPIPVSSKLNFISDKVILVNLLDKLCAEQFILRGKHWKIFSKNFLWKNKIISNKDLLSQHDRQSNEEDLEISKIISALN